jgi:ABC-type multidrug transport system fused ATPase/permease subunit
MAPSPNKSGYAKLSLEEDADLLDPDEVETEDQRIRNFKNCPSEKKEWPELKSSCCNRLVFAWYEPLIKLGGRVPLEMEDVWQLDPGDQAPPNSQRFWQLWQEEIARAEKKTKRTGKEVTPWLGRPLVRLTWRPLMKGAFMRVSCDMLSFARPLLMQQILLICEGSPAIVSRDNAWFLAVAMASASILQMFLNTHYENNINRVAFRVRCAIVGALYKKTIKLSSGAKASYSSGKIVNMMGNDAMKCMWMVWQINWAWGIPFNFAMALYLLVQVVGDAAYAGVVLVGICMPPLMAFWMKQGSKIRKAQMKQTDQRSKEMTEVLTSIRIIKFMSWEERFIDKITKTRNEELRLYRRSQLLNTGLSAVFMTIPLMMVALVIGLYGYNGGVITASMAFTTISLMDMVRGPLTSISWILNSVFVDGRTSVDRLSRFMTTEEAVQYVESTPFRAERPAVKLSNLTIQHPNAVEAVFDPDEQRKTVADVFCSLCCPKSLYSCYKSIANWNNSHWHCMCLPLCCKKKDKKADGKDGKGKGGDGDKSDKGKDKDKDKDKDKKDDDVERGPCVIGADLEVQHGDLCCLVGKVGSGKSSLLLSLMGEIDKLKGSVTLSGNLSYAAQTACVLNCTVRENILYGKEYDEERYEKVVHACALVDDIKNLEAGDQTQIGEKGISLSGGQKQRVGLARAIYHEADIYLLDDPLSAVDAHTGAHIFEHCIDGLLKDKTVILPVHNLSYLERADQIVVLEDKAISEQGTYAELIKSDKAFSKMMAEFSATEDGDGAESVKKTKGGADEEASDTPRVKGDGKMMETEERERGGVSGDVYVYYLKQAHWCAALLIIFSFIVSQSTGVGQNFWMTRWAVQDPEFIVGYDDTWSQNEVLAWFLGVYCIAAFINSTSNNVRRLIITLIGLRTSRKLHRNLLIHIMKAPVKFFDVTPVGRIVNRFTSDVGSIDQSVIQQWAGLSDQLMTTIVGLAISSLATPFIWAAVVPVFYVFWNIQNMYRKTARELKRLSSIARSPIFAHFNETITSLTTVRAFEQEERLIIKNDMNNDKFGRAMLAQNVCFRWLAIRLNSMSTMLTSLVTTWICLHPDQLDPGLTAMVITYSLQVTGYLQWLINTFTQLEIEMNSCARHTPHSTRYRSWVPFIFCSWLA